MRRRAGVLVLAALTAIVATGCTEEKGTPTGDAAPSAPTSTGEPWYDEVAPAPAAGSVGGAGGPCPLPVSFSLPEQWTPKPVEVPEGELAEVLGEALTRRGGATVRCEVDGRRAGGGFLRIWTADDPAVEARPALEAFVAGDEKVSGQEFRSVRAGGVDAVEATWVSTSELTEDTNRSWAFAVRADGRTVLVAVSESLLAEARDLLPGYRLAGRSLTVG
ncbi:lipoprotein [Micromonospora coxensis]|uniref:lipoprotein n=1 Tax=Micromonospora coxensis TaxID=356852 RepID=UPI00342F4DD0